jgi:hypothetical protein
MELLKVFKDFSLRLRIQDTSPDINGLVSLERIEMSSFDLLSFLLTKLFHYQSILRPLLFFEFFSQRDRFRKDKIHVTLFTIMNVMYVDDM